MNTPKSLLFLLSIVIIYVFIRALTRGLKLRLGGVARITHLNTTSNRRSQIFVALKRRFVRSYRLGRTFPNVFSKHFSTFVTRSSTHTLEKCFPWKRIGNCSSDLTKSSRHGWHARSFNKADIHALFTRLVCTLF